MIAARVQREYQSNNCTCWTSHGTSGKKHVPRRDFNGPYGRQAHVIHDVLLLMRYHEESARRIWRCG